jgi:hypothetical protein
MLVNCLGQVACRRWQAALFSHTDQRLKAACIDATYDRELCRLVRVGLVFGDNFCLHPMAATVTHDSYQIMVEPHRRSATRLTEGPDCSTLSWSVAPRVQALSGVCQAADPSS